jgi:hypothetical protein
MNREEWIEENITTHGLLDIMGPDFYEAIIGVADSFGRDQAIAYDYDKVIEIFAEQFKDDAHKEDDPRQLAQEWFNYNVIGYGRSDVETPVFITTVSDSF